MITVGVAGHIDHGKSSVVKRLTGVDPDRLPEEKERGMTIDLGFARWKIPGGSDEDVVSFVDVPGHERFVRNMIAGAGGIEAIALVIAADDGWMPQSQEHFEIVRLLNVRGGVIIVTKVDLVEPDWITAVIEDIQSKVRGSFLENAEIVPVSSTTGAGYDRLETALTALTREKMPTQNIGKPRLFVDRSFDMPGMGKVVTGSMRGGSLSEGDKVVVYPDQANGKVRALQRHGVEVSKVEPGQRTALAFTGIDREILSRGKVITTPELAADAGEANFLIVELQVLPDCPVKMSHRRQLLFFLGTSEIRCELRMPGGGVIAAGDKAVCVLRCEREPFCLTGDHFVVRLPTPQLTVGGGVVLNWSSSLPKRAQLEDVRCVWALDKPDIERALRLALREREFTAPVDLLRRSSYSTEQITGALKDLRTTGVVAERGGKWFLKSETSKAIDFLSANVERVFAEQPHHKGLLPDELSRMLPVGFVVGDERLFFELALETGRLTHNAGRFAPAGATQSVTGPVKKEAERILAELKSAPFAPPLIPLLVKPGKSARDALGYLFDAGAVVKVTSELALERDAWLKTLGVIAQALRAKEKLTVAYLRSKLDTSRKYALPILETTDRLGYTERDGDVRTPGRKVEELYSLMERRDSLA